MAESVIQCPGVCTVTVVHTFTVEPPDWTAWGVTPQNMASAFGFGLAAVLSMWAIGWAVGVLVGMVRKA